MTFLDSFSRLTTVYQQISKDEVSFILPLYQKTVKTPYNASIKRLKSDNGRKYISQKLLQGYLKKQGIESQMTCPYTPQQNGVAEWKKRHLLEVIRAPSFEMNLQKSLWSEAVLT